jgi:class 3 adenylate cyclase
MTFEEVLHQTLAMLKHHGRVSYRALKRQFDLDDAYLEDLKYEIIEVQRRAFDQDGQMLVWTGEVQATPAPTPPFTSPPRQYVTQDVFSSAVASQPPGLPLPSAERRQLTVLFCDVVDSTTLSSQLDAEDYRDVVRAYQVTCAEVIQRFDGHIAQYLGDGLLVYFGYPQAHEDDAQRAVRAGLGIVQAMEQLNASLKRYEGVRLAVRVGIHTGQVVIGDIGAADRREPLALGEAPNIAARIQGLAAPNTVVVSATSFRLIEGHFACHDLGPQALRGMVAPLQLYRVLSAYGTRSRLEAGSRHGLTPFVGRASEVRFLLERWAQVKEGVGQAILLGGEAGIGKSRLVQVFTDHIAGEPQVRLECRGSPYYQHTALYPVTELLERLLWGQQTDTR